MKQLCKWKCVLLFLMVFGFVALPQTAQSAPTQNPSTPNLAAVQNPAPNIQQLCENCHPNSIDQNPAQMAPDIPQSGAIMNTNFKNADDSGMALATNIPDVGNGHQNLSNDNALTQAWATNSMMVSAASSVLRSKTMNADNYAAAYFSGDFQTQDAYLAV